MKTPRLALVLATVLAAVAMPALFSSHSGAVRADGPLALHTTDLGRGPTIVFVHGLGGSRSGWMPTARKLIGRHRIVLVDLPGHGDSKDVVPDPFSLKAVADALDGVLARYNPDSTIVVAHGMGGLVAIQDLATHPGRARALLLVDAGLKSPVQIPDQEQKYFLDYMDKNYDQFLSMLFKRMGRDSTQGVAIHAVASLANPVAIRGFFREILNFDGNVPLKSVTAPVEMVVTDRLWPEKATWGATAKQLGWDDSTRVSPRRIVNAGYWVMQDQPDTLASVVADFVARSMAAKKK